MALARPAIQGSDVDEVAAAILADGGRIVMESTTIVGVGTSSGSRIRRETPWGRVSTTSTPSDALTFYRSG